MPGSRRSAFKPTKQEERKRDREEVARALSAVPVEKKNTARNEKNKREEANKNRLNCDAMKDKIAAHMGWDKVSIAKCKKWLTTNGKNIPNSKTEIYAACVKHMGLDI